LLDRTTGLLDRTTGLLDRTTGLLDRTTGLLDRTTGLLVAWLVPPAVGAMGRGLRAALVLALLGTACATAPPALAETYQITDLFGTGVDNSGALISQGQSDPHYTITKVQFLSGTTGPGYPPTTDSTWLGAPKAYRIDQWAPNNIAAARPSQWVAPNGATEALPPFTPTGQFVDAPVAQYYAYQTTFTIPDSEWESATISGQWVADNTGTGIFLNGSRIDALASWSYTSDNTTGTLFRSGVNTLEFRVRNLIESAGDFANPTGLQVTMVAAYYTATPVPEPSVAILGAMGVATAVGFRTPSLRRRLAGSGRGRQSRQAPQRRAQRGFGSLSWQRRAAAGTADDAATDPGRATGWQAASAPTWAPRRTVWGARSSSPKGRRGR
jgi:hypothetical protein